jgi:hypothetical protein
VFLIALLRRFVQEPLLPAIDNEFPFPFNLSSPLRAPFPVDNPAQSRKVRKERIQDSKYWGIHGMGVAGIKAMNGL